MAALNVTFTICRMKVGPQNEGKCYMGIMSVDIMLRGCCENLIKLWKLCVSSPQFACNWKGQLVWQSGTIFWSLFVASLQIPQRRKVRAMAVASVCWLRRPGLRTAGVSMERGVKPTRIQQRVPQLLPRAHMRTWHKGVSCLAPHTSLHGSSSLALRPPALTLSLCLPQLSLSNQEWLL